MKLFENKKNTNETQNKAERNINNAKKPNYDNDNSKKPLFLDRSDYGWDGNY